MGYGERTGGSGGDTAGSAGVRRALRLSEQGFAEAFAGLVEDYRAAEDTHDFDGAPGRPEGVHTASQVLAGVRHAVMGLRSAISWLTASGGSAAGTDPELLAAVLVGLGEVDSAVVAAVSRGIVRAEESDCAGADGQASPADWVAKTMRLSGSAARRSCRLAADLDGLPEVLASLETAEISRDHAIELVEADRQQRRDHEAAERARRKAAKDAEERARAAADAAAQAARDAAERERLRRTAAEEQRRRREREAAEAARRAAEAEAARTARQDDLLDKARGGDSPDDISDEAARQRAGDPDALLRAEAEQWRRRDRTDQPWPAAPLHRHRAA